MARKKLISDEAVLLAAEKALRRMGAEKLTLADVGRESGIAAATLLQRFGSKRVLMLKVANARVRRVKADLERIQERNGDALDGLVAVYSKWAQEYDSPQEAANDMAFWQGLAGDDELRTVVRELTQEMESGTKRLLWEALKAGKIRQVQGAKLARGVVSVYWGAVMFWSVLGEGKADTWVRDRVREEVERYQK
jgi:AcrR family transcriptional regulator